jgi:hypothetical protein
MASKAPEEPTSYQTPTPISHNREVKHAAMPPGAGQSPDALSTNKDEGRGNRLDEIA